MTILTVMIAANHPYKQRKSTQLPFLPVATPNDLLVQITIFYPIIIIILPMTSNRLLQTQQNPNRFLNHHILFKKNSNPQRLSPFQPQVNNVQPYRTAHQQNPIVCAVTPLSSSDKSHLIANLLSSNRNRKTLQIVPNDNATFLNDSLQKERKSPLKRALSSNRFDLITTKEAKRKGKKFTQNIFEYAKVLKKQSNSKKSTDESSETPVQSLKAENEEYRERIRQQQARMRKLQLAIAEQKKKHELQKHLYNTNIEKLKKLVCINTIQNSEQEESELTMIEDEGYDALSIESN